MQTLEIYNEIHNTRSRISRHFRTVGPRMSRAQKELLTTKGIQHVVVVSGHVSVYGYVAKSDRLC